MVMRGVFGVLGAVLFVLATVFMYRITLLRASPPLMATHAEIRRIDAEAFRLVAKARLSEDDAFALYERLARLESAYIQRLATREGEEAFEKRELKGSIAPVAEKVLCDALPDECIYLWKTFDDYRASLDEVIRADTDFVLRAEEAFVVGKDTDTPLTSTLDDTLREEEQEQYDAMLAARTPAQARAALIWHAGEGTRRTPGVLLDLISGYLSLDTERSLAQYVELRSEILTAAYRLYLDAETSHAAYVSPRATNESFPSSLIALRGATLALNTLISEQGKKDLAAELAEARNSLWWSGAYYEYAINDAMTRTLQLP
ncbi:hypothetical protein A3C87_01510 [Candidatus Kaiserbacteria bacterium RIFCSPHIGHO2_02_FULL_49_34]|uniref:Uncharacterized protein n=1 Tax=Candidatus Kaiserbacteria bacterium RIFCSPHIGHO2_02_FULL_49_34 TaxID=1798491 RepID=A0A1F6DIP9_9BACT|nr:MAG: hypothetical protein A3C87_01510 [Candidatus Kaiserbacteria bacterium RIFCSPHIGHO2_02_FULL_49_34]